MEKQGCGTGEAQLEEFPTSYIEEEILEELYSQDIALVDGYISSKDMESDKEKKEESQGQGADMEQ
jgi:hypothetical protein